VGKNDGDESPLVTDESWTPQRKSATDSLTSSNSSYIVETPVIDTTATNACDSSPLDDVVIAPEDHQHLSDMSGGQDPDSLLLGGGAGGQQQSSERSDSFERYFGNRAVKKLLSDKLSGALRRSSGASGRGGLSSNCIITPSSASNAAVSIGGGNSSSSSSSSSSFAIIEAGVTQSPPRGGSTRDSVRDPLRRKSPLSPRGGGGSGTNGGAIDTLNGMISLFGGQSGGASSGNSGSGINGGGGPDLVLPRAQQLLQLPPMSPSGSRLLAASIASASTAPGSARARAMAQAGSSSAQSSLLSGAQISSASSSSSVNNSVSSSSSSSSSSTNLVTPLPMPMPMPIPMPPTHAAVVSASAAVPHPSFVSAYQPSHGIAAPTAASYLTSISSSSSSSSFSSSSSSSSSSSLSSSSPSSPSALFGGGVNPSSSNTQQHQPLPVPPVHQPSFSLFTSSAVPSVFLDPAGALKALAMLPPSLSMGAAAIALADASTSRPSPTLTNAIGAAAASAAVAAAAAILPASNLKMVRDAAAGTSTTLSTSSSSSSSSPSTLPAVASSLLQAAYSAVSGTGSNISCSTKVSSIVTDVRDETLIVSEEGLLSIPLQPTNSSGQMKEVDENKTETSSPKPLQPQEVSSFTAGLADTITEDGAMSGAVRRLVYDHLGSTGPSSSSSMYDGSPESPVEKTINTNRRESDEISENIRDNTVSSSPVTSSSTYPSSSSTAPLLPISPTTVFLHEGLSSSSTPVDVHLPSSSCDERQISSTLIDETNVTSAGKGNSAHPILSLTSAPRKARSALSKKRSPLSSNLEKKSRGEESEEAEEGAGGGVNSQKGLSLARKLYMKNDEDAKESKVISESPIVTLSKITKSAISKNAKSSHSSATAVVATIPPSAAASSAESKPQSFLSHLLSGRGSGTAATIKTPGSSSSTQKSAAITVQTKATAVPTAPTPAPVLAREKFKSSRSSPAFLQLQLPQSVSCEGGGEGGQVRSSQVRSIGSSSNVKRGVSLSEEEDEEEEEDDDEKDVVTKTSTVIREVSPAMVAKHRTKSLPSASGFLSKRKSDDNVDDHHDNFDISPRKKMRLERTPSLLKLSSPDDVVQQPTTLQKPSVLLGKLGGKASTLSHSPTTSETNHLRNVSTTKMNLMIKATPKTSSSSMSISNSDGSNGPATSLTPRSSTSVRSVSGPVMDTNTLTGGEETLFKRQTSLAASLDQQLQPSPSPRPMRMARDPAKQAAFVNRFANLGTKPSRITNSLLSLSAQSQSSQTTAGIED
jgi:trimeric autotransporter adhesin